MTRREYAGGAPETALAAGITSSALSFTVSSGGGAGYPTGSGGPFFVIIDPTTGGAEKVLCSSRDGDVFTVAGSGRGADDTVATSHSTGAVVQHIFTATDADEANQHINTDAAVHGVTGNVVGDSDLQTLTSKTMSGSLNTFSDIPQTAVTDLDSDLTDHENRIAANEVVVGQFHFGSSDLPNADASDPPSSYPYGLSVWEAFSGGGFPTAGILLNWRYDPDERAYQELKETDSSEAADIYHRHWRGSSWSAWNNVADLSSNQIFTNKTIDGDDNTLRDVGLGSLKRAVLSLEGNGDDFFIGDNEERFRTTMTTIDNVGGFQQGAFTAERIVPYSGLYLAVQGGRFLCSAGSNEEVEIRIRRGGTAGEHDGALIARSAGNFASGGVPEAYVTQSEVIQVSAGERVKFLTFNHAGETVEEDGNPDWKHAGLIYLGPT